MIRVLLTMSLAFFLLAEPCSATPWVQDDQDAKAFQLVKRASLAMEEDSWRDAIVFWKQLIEDHPKSRRIPKAWYGLAKCHYKLEDYPNAVPAFEKAVNLLQSEDVKSLEVPDATLLLGFSRWQAGRKIAEDASQDKLIDPENLPREASVQLTTATQNFGFILRDFPEYENGNQAAYFQGQAFIDLGRLDEAEASFAKSLKFPKDDYQQQTLMALGALADRQERPAQSAKYYDQLLGKIGDQPSEFTTEAKYRLGEALMRLGESDREDGDVAASTSNFTRAQKLLTAAGADAKYPLRDRVLFRQAWCSLILEQPRQAAEGFEAVAAMDKSELSSEAKVRAGESWLELGEVERGRKHLDAVIASRESWRIDAVDVLARFLIRNDQPQEALDLANQWAKKAEGHPNEIRVLMDQAEATAAIDETQDQSAALFETIAERFKSHNLAPKALYLSALANVKSGKPEKAITQAEKFEKLYDGDDFTPDMLEVKGESLLLAERYADAESSFRKLVNENSGQKTKLPYWITRVGFASYLQENYDVTVEWLEKNEGNISAPERKAESLYWIGASRFQKREFAGAVRDLEQSLTVNNSWSRAPEVMLALCNAYLETGSSVEARKTAQELKKRFSDDPDESVSRAFYVLGDFQKNDEKYADALESFDVVAKEYPKSNLAENASYQAAYCALKNGDADDAAKRFTTFAKRYPESRFANEANLAASNALRNAGNPEDAIERLERLVENGSDAATRNGASLQLGLVYADQKKWDKAITIFRDLTTQDSESESAPTYWYELGWAQKESGDNEGSLKSFASMVEKYPDCEHVPEAHFLLGSKAYSDKKFPEAIRHYQLADVESARDEIREKSRYKMGWSQFRGGNFAAAEKAFREQVKGFPKGVLYADGLYMVGQSAFREDRFDEAFESFATAQPVVKSSDSVSDRIKLNTLLYGAKSGNRIKKFQESAAMAEALVAHPKADTATIQQAQLELGVAHNGLGQRELAMKALKVAADSQQVTGAKAMALLGDAWFAKAVEAAKADDNAKSKQNFDEAIDLYRGLYFGWRDAPAEIKSWQAYALYESGRCSMVQIKGADASRRADLITEAKRQFGKLVERFPKDRLAPEAAKQLETLNKLGN